MIKEILLITLLLLTACSTQPIAKDKININSDVQSCKVYYDHIECTLVNGDIYYMLQSDINLKTTWDKSAWKVQDDNNTTNKTN